MNAPGNAWSICGPHDELAMHVRTDVRTNGEASSPTGDNSPSVTRTRTYDDLTFADLLEEAIDVLEAAGTRLGSPRSEPREEIHHWTRRAIYWRDGNRCGWCYAGFAAGMLVLDHIRPWAAGGSDRSDNLRTLCVPCNERRSNFATDAAYTRVLPVGLCDTCANRATPTRRAFELDPESTFRRPIFCGNCGHVRDCTDRRRVL